MHVDQYEASGDRYQGRATRTVSLSRRSTLTPLVWSIILDMYPCTALRMSIVVGAIECHERSSSTFYRNLLSCSTWSSEWVGPRRYVFILYSYTRSTLHRNTKYNHIQKYGTRSSSMLSSSLSPYSPSLYASLKDKSSIPSNTLSGGRDGENAGLGSLYGLIDTAFLPLGTLDNNSSLLGTSWNVNCIIFYQSQNSCFYR